MLARDKHSSLVGLFVIYEENEVLIMVLDTSLYFINFFDYISEMVSSNGQLHQFSQ
jgi:hypothetical protein